MYQEDQVNPEEEQTPAEESMENAPEEEQAPAEESNGCGSPWRSLVS